MACRLSAVLALTGRAAARRRYSDTELSCEATPSWQLLPCLQPARLPARPPAAAALLAPDRPSAGLPAAAPSLMLSLTALPHRPHAHSLHAWQGRRGCQQVPALRRHPLHRPLSQGGAVGVWEGAEGGLVYGRGHVHANQWMAGWPCSSGRPLCLQQLHHPPRWAGWHAPSWPGLPLTPQLYVPPLPSDPPCSGRRPATPTWPAAPPWPSSWTPEASPLPPASLCWAPQRLPAGADASRSGCPQVRMPAGADASRRLRLRALQITSGHPNTSNNTQRTLIHRQGQTPRNNPELSDCSP